jgi:hypothetical protein
MDLDARQVARLVVVKGTDYDVRRRSDSAPLIDTKDAAAIQSLIGALDHDGSTPSDIALMSWPTHTFVFMDVERRELARYGYLGGGWLRAAGSGDRRVRSVDAVDGWLGANSPPAP